MFSNETDQLYASGKKKICFESNLSKYKPKLIYKL